MQIAINEIINIEKDVHELYHGIMFLSHENYKSPPIIPFKVRIYHSYITYQQYQPASYEIKGN